MQGRLFGEGAEQKGGAFNRTGFCLEGKGVKAETAEASSCDHTPKSAAADKEFVCV